MIEVSVVIPTYRRPELLIKTIESVLNQTFSDWEMIIVDDNGKGTPAQLETEGVLEAYLSDRRICYLVQELNSGGSAARNLGWRSAQGKYVCFLDNDDEFYPKKLAFQYENLENSEYKATVCGFDSFKNGGKVKTSPRLSKQDNYLIPFVQGKINFASGSTLMIAKKLLEKIDGFDERFRRKQDVELMIRILAVEKLLIDDRILVRLNIDDRSNIPSLVNFKKSQDLFNSKFKDLFMSFSKDEQGEIEQYNLIELSKVALWNKDVREFSRIFFSTKLKLRNKILLFKDLASKFITYYVR